RWRRTPALRPPPRDRPRRTVEAPAGVFLRTCTPSPQPSQPDHLDALEDLLDRDQISLARARADLAGGLPRFRTGNVTVPERPGAGLAGPDRVDNAALFAVVKNAISLGVVAQVSAPAMFA